MKLFFTIVVSLFYFTAYSQVKENIITCGYVVNINPIYFKNNSSKLIEKSEKELYKIVVLMKKYPKMVIESGSYTDSKEKNVIKLSNKRAKAVADYIIEKGISPKRILSKGYGDTELIKNCNNNCTEKERAKNRRTEFVIIKM